MLFFITIYKTPTVVISIETVHAERTIILPHRADRVLDISHGNSELTYDFSCIRPRSDNL